MNANTLLEIVCWTAGALALTAHGGVQLWQQVAHASGLHDFEAARSNVTPVPRSERALSPAPATSVDTSTWSPKRIAQYEDAIRDGVAPQGVLSIPSLGLRVPIYEGTNERNLHRGAARIEGTAQLDELGNIGIAAHRDGFFRVLEKVAVGDEVTIERLDGIETYRITETLIVQPSETSVLRSSERPMVTLVTCYPFYYVGAAPKRFIVRAARIDPPQSSGAAEPHSSKLHQRR